MNRMISTPACDVFFFVLLLSKKARSSWRHGDESDFESKNKEVNPDLYLNHVSTRMNFNDKQTDSMRPNLIIERAKLPYPST